MPCTHDRMVDCNGATGSPGRRRCEYADALACDTGRAVPVEEQESTEDRLCPNLYRHSPADGHYQTHINRGSIDYPCSELQSLDESIERADIGAASPHLQVTPDFEISGFCMPTITKSLSQSLVSS